jgi:Uma2 family endonuclease
MQLVIDLPPRDEQIAFNRRRWEELCADPELAKVPGRIETNAHGQILMSPPPAGSHSHRTGKIVLTLQRLIQGVPLPECPISTIDGVRAADVGWYSEERFAQVEGQVAFEMAPEICVEVLSPSNTSSEMREKRKLYFEAGAQEVWLCAEDGRFQFFTAVEVEARASNLCPTFPASI